MYIGKKLKLIVNISIFKQTTFKYTTNTKPLENIEKNLLKITFFGTDLFSLIILNGLNDLFQSKKIADLKVVTCDGGNKRESTTSQNSFKANHVINYCNLHNLNYYLWSDIKTNAEYKNVLVDQELGIVASFGHLIPSNLINIYKHGVVNIHPSMLPRWRGAAPLVYSILYDDKVTGVSLMKIMPKNFDVGPIITQESVDIPEGITTLKLLYYLANISVKILKNFVENFDKLKDRAQLQSSHGTTYAHKLNTEMFYIDWENRTCSEIDCQYRALHEIAHLKSEFQNRIIKFYEMDEIINIESLDMSKPPGYVHYMPHEKLLVIKCKDGYIGFRNVVYKKKMSAMQFYNGYINKKSEIFFKSINKTFSNNIYKAKI